MKNTNIYLIIFLLIFFHINFSIHSIPRRFSLERKKLYKEYSCLSCKIDSLYYALEYFIDNLPPIDWFINKIPSKKENYLKLNNDNTYSISDPLKAMIGSFWGQQARFSYSCKLFILYENKAMPVYYDKNNFLDSIKVYKQYGRIISFGLDDDLLISTFKDFFEERNISYKFFNLKNPSIDDVVSLFTELIFSKNIIFCNSIAGGLKNARTFDFNVIETGKIYKWKEASHSIVLIGYDLDKKNFHNSG